MALTRKLVLVKIFTSNHFWIHAQRERERERERKKREPRSRHEPRAQITPSTSPIYELIYEPTNRSSTQSLQPTSLRLADDPEPSRYEPANQSLSLCDFDFLCDFDQPTNRSTFLCDFDFLLSLFDI